MRPAGHGVGTAGEALAPRLILVGFTPPDDAQALPFYEAMDLLAERVPTLMLVASGGDVDLRA